ncbi:DUF5788 family protein [Haloarchaeobius sp. DFWS5]|uniref:DUF5788 family protein n=1 Tax=Haloarchaeobius sp. DFWS5 TaxID=3446114 RepID=UPI003EBF2EB0
MKAYEQKRLLARLDREGATVGATIPDRIEVQGEELDLHEFVFEIKRRDTIPPGERDRVQQAKRNLRRERLQRRQRIEDDWEALSVEEGEELVEAVIGIDRALNALENLGTTNLEGEAKAKEAADQKRWMSFLKKALGHGDDGPR